VLASSGISPKLCSLLLTLCGTHGDHRNNFKMATKLSVEEVLNKVLENNADTNQAQIRSENESSNVLTQHEKREPGIPSHVVFIEQKCWKGC
jgi:hypothetical protein